MSFFRFSSFRAILIAFFVLTGCSLTKDETLQWPVQKLYTEAKANLDSGSYSTARKQYKKLLTRFPSGRYAQQTQLDFIQLEYKNKEYDKAIGYADEFLRVYPKSPYADYARYMKGVIAYSRDVSFLDKMVPTNIAQSDQNMMKKAYKNFESLVENSPDSDYADDAKQRMLYLKNINAEHEIYVAEYYLRRGAYLAAANRGKYVVKKYQTTPSIPIALAVMIRAYRELDMPQLAEDTQRVLDKNFPGVINNNKRVNFILNGNIKKKKGFFERLTQSLTN